MIRLNRLSEMTDRALDGLRADEGLKRRILAAAGEQALSQPKPLFQRLVPVLCCVSAAALLLVFGLTRSAGRTAPASRRVFTVASHTSVSPLSLQGLLSDGSLD